MLPLRTRRARQAPGGQSPGSDLRVYKPWRAQSATCKAWAEQPDSSSKVRRQGGRKAGTPSRRRRSAANPGARLNGVPVQVQQREGTSRARTKLSRHRRVRGKGKQPTTVRPSSCNWEEAERRQRCRKRRRKAGSGFGYHCFWLLHKGRRAISAFRPT